MENKLQTRKTYEIDKPLQMVKMASVLKNHIVRNKLYAQIAGKNYVMVEGWQFAGGLLGLFPRIVKVENVSAGKWLAQVEIINKKDGQVVSSGFAICSKDEDKKKSFDEYAILSMAQTRAIGKAFRNLIGWVMKLTGYESTPAEEMKGKIASAPESPGNSTQNAKNGTKLDELKGMLKGETDAQKIADLKKRTGILLKGFAGVSDKHAGILVASLLNEETK